MITMKVWRQSGKDILVHIRSSLSFITFATSLTRPFPYVAFACGFIGFFFQPQTIPYSPLLFFALAFTEELTWRCLLQHQGECSRKNVSQPKSSKTTQHKNKTNSNTQRFLKLQKIHITSSNILFSLCFALTHVLFSPSFFSLLTFFPSLIFGIVWTRTQSLWLCTLIHFWYNYAFFYLSF